MVEGPEIRCSLNLPEPVLRPDAPAVPTESGPLAGGGALLGLLVRGREALVSAASPRIPRSSSTRPGLPQALSVALLFLVPNRFQGTRWCVLSISEDGSLCSPEALLPGLQAWGAPVFPAPPAPREGRAQQPQPPSSLTQASPSSSRFSGFVAAGNAAHHRRFLNPSLRGPHWAKLRTGSEPVVSLNTGLRGGRCVSRAGGGWEGGRAGQRWPAWGSQTYPREGWGWAPRTPRRPPAGKAGQGAGGRGHSDHKSQEEGRAHHFGDLQGIQQKWGAGLRALGREDPRQGDRLQARWRLHPSTKPCGASPGVWPSPWGGLQARVIQGRAGRALLRAGALGRDSRQSQETLGL